MSRPGSPDPWIPPWRAGLAQDTCRGTLPGGKACAALVVAVTLTDGLCAQCASRPGVLQMTLRLEAS